MPLRRLAENRIREAIEAGVFDHLPGAGQPLDLEEYFSCPEELRLAHSLLKNANCVPLEVELRNEIVRLRAALERPADEETRRSLRRTLVRRETELAIHVERGRRRK